MSVAASSLSVVVYLPDGVADSFAVPFTFQDAADLAVVSLDPATGTITTLSGYTVTGGKGGTGQIAFAEPPMSTLRLIIRRDTPRSQLLDLNYNEGLSLELFEDALDKLTRIAQEVGRDALRFSPAESITYQLPPPEQRAGKFLLFDTAGVPELLTAAEVKTILDAI